MKRESLIALLAVVLLILSSSKGMAQEIATIYSPLNSPAGNLEMCLNFQTGLSKNKRGPCDLRFGTISINADSDWIQSATAGDRSLIRDLGPLSWSDKIKVPFVPALQPGERRPLYIDASANQASRNIKASSRPATSPNPPPGDPVNGGFVNVDGRFIPERRPLNTVEPATPDVAYTTRKRQPPKESTVVRAVVAHVYVIRVVDDVNDYYALFRVESVETGTSCTISWRLIPAPPDKK